MKQKRKQPKIKEANKMRKYRHGDVLILECAAPKGGDELKHLTLAEGEVTGHSHRIVDGIAKLTRFDDKMYLKVQGEIGTLAHEEHPALSVPQGNYEIVIQREYEPNGWKYVAD